MEYLSRVRVLVAIMAAAIGAAAAGPVVSAQRIGAAQPPTTPRASAAIDLAGYWVSVVTEDWLWRMVTPRKGDYSSVPMTPEARKVADTWDVSKDGSCMAYGAAGLMRIPTRLHVTWESDTVLNIETDAGMQTRRLEFNKPPRLGPRSPQGVSVAEWERGAGPGGSLKVTTTNMTSGWVRKNGVPYSENAVMTEYYDRFTTHSGEVWFTLTTIVDDPKYFTQPFITGTRFKKEPDGAKWSPSPCKVMK